MAETESTGPSSAVAQLSSDSTLSGFSLPDPGFDPSNNHAIKAYYEKKEKKGVLADEDGIEGDIEEEAERAVTDWEEAVGRKATDEERENMKARIRQIRAGEWLEGAKAQLVGKATVPIAWFNRLVAQNEGVIQFVAQKSVEMKQRRQEANGKIAELLEEFERLKDAQVASEDIDKLKAQIEKLEQEVSTLQDDLTKAEEKLKKLGEENDQLKTQLKESQDREKNLQDKYDRQTSELNVCYRNLRDREEKIEQLEEEARAIRRRERAVRNDNRNLEKTIAELKRRLEDSENDKNKATPSTAPAPSAEFDTMKILRELKEAKEKDEELKEESKELLDRWMAQVADRNNLLEFYNAVGEVRESMGKLKQRVVAFYHSLGYDDDTVRSAGEALDNLEEQIREQPQQRLGARLWGLKLLAEKQMLGTELMTQVIRNDTLNMKLEMAKPDEQIDMEIRMEYNIFNDIEINKRVAAETQMYRAHRRELVGKMFECGERLNLIAVECPDQPTREAITTASRECLSLPSLMRLTPVAAESRE
ncbi:uncharacterized protein F4817DRAFT_249813 [Daldinia loculata]|uniref:uncharacterized protein n=1 Tax=Daldinia loculata TaxID=103429 RepID=UPI0020C41000|nr:uncharacterized protein F4817DRAFT_249813 [Daldinia loculata]KAI1643552.1 hypothetical protein F4817DRAFT_249813 [Daldinia loculata]